MFQDRSAAFLANPSTLGYGVAVLDYSGDANLAFFVAGFGFPNRLLAWENGRLIDLYDEALYAADRQTIGVAAGDVDGDGREEIYLLNTDAFAGYKRFGDQCFAWRDDRWIDLFSLPVNHEFVNQFAGRSVCAVDTAGDGRARFWVANYGGPMRLYGWDEPGRLTDGAESLGLDRVTGGRALLALPLVSPPGRLDLVAANENGPNFLFVPQAPGVYAEVALEAGLADPGGNGRGIAPLDANGRFDLVAGNWQDEHRLWSQSTPGFFEDAAPPELRRPSAVRTVLTADFDNDGYEEIFFHNLGEPNRLFGWRDDRWKRLPIGDAEEPDGLGTGAAVADIDGDGRLELLLSHGETELQPLSLFGVAPNDNHWLRVAPRTRFGAPARGALVTLAAGGRTQRRVVDGGSGYLCQMEPVAHFGLGALDQVEYVEIVWPGGARRVLDNPAIDQLLKVPYPSG